MKPPNGRIPADPDACRATQYSDQMRCPLCGRTCDVNELAPPRCPLTLRPTVRAHGPALGTRS